MDVFLDSYIVKSMQQKIWQEGCRSSTMAIDSNSVYDVVSGQYDFDSFLRMVAIILRSGDEFEKDLSSVFRMFDIQAKGQLKWLTTPLGYHPRREVTSRESFNGNRLGVWKSENERVLEDENANREENEGMGI